MADLQEAKGTSGNRMQYRCSFCGKGQAQVVRLIAGPGAVYICNECVDLCREIINEEPEKSDEVQINARLRHERLLTDVLLEVTPKEIMRDPRFIANALNRQKSWWFDVGPNGDVRMQISVSGETIAAILESLGEAHDENAEE